MASRRTGAGYRELARAPGAHGAPYVKALQGCDAGMANARRVRCAHRMPGFHGAHGAPYVKAQGCVAGMANARRVRRAHRMPGFHDTHGALYGGRL